MQCKYCGAELEDGNLLCPACGKDQAAEEARKAAPAEAVSQKEVRDAKKEKKPVQVWQVVLITLGCIVLLAALVFAVLYGMGVRFASAPEEPTSTQAPETKPSTLATAVRDHYSVSDEDAAAKAGDVVATIGDVQLKNNQLQVFYWMGVYDFIDKNGPQLPMYGLDLSKPLGEQINNPQTGDTWEQAFLDYALQSWQRYTTICLMGREAGHQLDTMIQEGLDKMPQELDKMAKAKGMESALDMIRGEMGPGADMEGYAAYMHASYYSLDYFNKLYESFQPTMEEVEAFFTENEAVFAQSMITKESGKMVDVRHILISPEGGTKDEKGEVTYSQQEWEACRAKAQGLLDELLAGEKTEEAFAEAAKKNSVDGGSAANGGLYTNVVKGRMVPEFDAWIFDESRQAGDYGLVKSPFGYHIMYFCGGEEIWIRQARAALISEMATETLEEAMKKWPMEVDYDRIALGSVNFNQSKEK